MSWKIVGIEGVVPDEASVVWGAAALSDGDRLQNSFTGVSATLADLARLREERHLHVFPTPIEIDDEHATEELVVVMVQKATRHESLFRPDVGRLGGVVTHAHRGRWRYYVFASRQAFAVYAGVAATAVLNKVMYGPSAVDNKDVVRIALTLTPGHPELNAMRAYLDGRPHVTRLARASVRSESAHRAFDLLLAALSSEGDKYELKYEDGAAAGGGFDVDIAAITLRAIQAATEAFSPYMHHHYPFLNDVPSPRLRELRAASAEFHFVPTVEGRSLGERVARYLSLHFIEDALRGERPTEITPSPELDAALRTIAQPAAATRLKQKRLSETEREDVVQPAAQASDPVFSPELTVLGIISGLEQDSKAELWIGPQRRFFVSTADDGKGDAPDGAEAIKGDGGFLRRPCVFTLVRETTNAGSERFHLRTMHVMRVGETRRINALPSGVLDGAFVIDVDVEVRYHEDATLVTSLGSFGGVVDGTLAIATRWLTDYRAACNEFEVAVPFDKLRWLPPSKREEASSLMRVLVVLFSLDGAAYVTDVVAGINERFRTVVRVNNTRREVRNNPELLTYRDEEKKFIALTIRGLSHVSAYIAAGGATEPL